MSFKMKTTFLFALGLICTVKALTISDPGDQLAKWVSPSGDDIQVINVTENNKGGRVTFVQVTDCNSCTYSDNSVDKTILDLQKVDDPASNGFNLTLENHDYEQLTTNNFVVSITEVGSNPSNRVTLSILFQNIDDESPTLTISGCTIPENTVFNVDTIEEENTKHHYPNDNCKFHIADADGLNRGIDFSGINGDKGSPEQYFEFAYKVQPDDNVYDSDVFLVLKAGKTLDYEEITLYTFRVEITDAGGNPTVPLPSIPVIVQVDDMPDQLPRWNSDFRGTYTIVEEEEAYLTVSATDGDVGINNKIGYRIDSDPEHYVTIDEDSGAITIKAIDRDAEDINQYTFSVMALEVDDPTSNITGEIDLIIQDIDDNVAVLSLYDSTDTTTIIDWVTPEGTTNFPYNLSANDIDAGTNATYDILLENNPDSWVVDDPDFASAFMIIPNQGFQDILLTLSLKATAKLDFEDPPWRLFSMILKTRGTHNVSMTDVFTINVNVTDVNDEPPQFDFPEYETDVNETIGPNESFYSIKATDKDAEDKDNLVHQILGTLANTILTIEEYGGQISTKVANAFDYEKQPELVVQIQATDKASHSATAQLTIHVLDVNDEPPRITWNGAFNIDENQQNNTELVLSDGGIISATDEDGTADLVFSINWEASYATKNSQPVSSDIFADYHCISVETVPTDTKNTVTAKLTILETQEGNTPDFEKFDLLHIQLMVIDQNTQVGRSSDTAMITINIQNANDNPPRFTDLDNVQRSVSETAQISTPIVSPIAVDDDGDKIDFTITKSDDDNDDDYEAIKYWVAIDNITGSIFVNGSIDCDYPDYRQNLKYTVIASDGKFNTPFPITIEILDQNNKNPFMENKTISIDELPNGDKSSNGKGILPLDPHDYDRDVHFYTVNCSFGPSSDEAAQRFDIDPVTNLLTINVKDNYNLDREETPSFTFSPECYDNKDRYSGQASNPLDPSRPVFVTIILNDINDNKPTILNKEISSANITENIGNGAVIATLLGEDLDDDDNGNGVIEFLEISKITRTGQNTDDVPPTDLFALAELNNKNASLTVNSANLRGYWGTLTLTIQLTDKGTPPLPNSVDVTVEVAKFNFVAPSFVYPDANTNTIYLQKTQSANQQLKLYDGSNLLQNFRVTDGQGSKYNIKYEIMNDAGSEEARIFNIIEPGDNQAQLQLKALNFTPQPFSVIIRASIDDNGKNIIGNAATSIDYTVQIDFFDLDTDPTFSEPRNNTVDFDENTSPVTKNPIPPAAYGNVNLPEHLDIFYALVQGNDSIFYVNETSAELTLLQDLDFEKNETYDLVIQASRSQKMDPNAIDQTKFNLHVTVNDLNDNAPSFDKKPYIATLLTIQLPDSNSAITTVSATDVDTTSAGKLKFSITSIDGTPDSLDSLPTPFAITTNANTGIITLRANLDRSMQGFFTLDVTVEDEDNLSDNTTVTIYLVTDANLVKFTFENDQDAVQAQKDNVKLVLDDEFEDSNYVTEVQDPQSDAPVNDAARTSVSIFFVDTETQKPVVKEDVYKKVINVAFFRQLRTHFLQFGLVLLSFDTSSSAVDNLSDTLKAWLIGVSVVTGSLCLILLIAFILKTRALKQRIDKLSNTKFGSQESGLNRTGVAAPTTNKHAIEGSNPVYNNDVDTKDIDRRTSVTSGDSDLIGIEDDEKFNKY